jgi:hypothetical protein
MLVRCASQSQRARGLDLLRAPASGECVPEHGALVNDDRADLDAVPRAGVLARRKPLRTARGRCIDDKGDRLAGKLGNLDIDSDRAQVEDAGP